jgi:NADH dehydrogenase [ubiquinone] 1 alpha subcomplex assembly factor 7
LAGGARLDAPGRARAADVRVTPLLEEIKRIIALEGPLTIERYMALCLGHPTHGYYATRDPFGAEGDFTTAPEISQIFGELLGLWTAEVWRLLGAPEPVRLVELGPGRGTLMSDLLRAGRVVPGFLAAADVHLVETSTLLRARQAEKLSSSPVPIAWHTDFSEVPAGPAIVVANEFFDALPVRQYLRTERGWCERLVGLGDDGGLTFGLAAEPDRRLPDSGAAGEVLEWPAIALDVVADLAARLVAHGGAALVIDYGHSASAFGDTLQAVKRHAFADPLAEPGEADLTVHLDFARLAEAAGACGAKVHGPVPQGEFLRALGIEARARALQTRATPAQAADLESALHRLTDSGPDGMGSLFKVMATSHQNLTALPGLPPPQAQ